MGAQEERKFMHDLSNPMAIAQGNIKLTLRKLKKDEGAMTISEIIERLEKTSEAFERINEMMSLRRSIIIEQQKEGA